jgi:hypothetical protein
LRSSARLLIDLIDWGYPEERRSYQPTIEHLSDPDTAMKYILAFGNGIINELRAEGETAEALQAIRGLALGTGACTLVELSADDASASGSMPRATNATGRAVSIRPMCS